ncbi:RNA polymerase sigma-70 factor, ECF subfamily [Paenibacillus sophorae]|uniref:RNA polymerase sigma factor n=1 Tax=Paenibacillus sophorae TaxID=1333845 RepID=A0A1H8L1X8_9BACL|nr:RNA polymerase sigma factor [Paenibacillus sophorae]QWU17480.1 RNA polymerase sigma factor [Paenibacillus sophorae]SEN98668.1 RNA polymerase sigma-70 factor, ECF subfamily [Paenibacillus sophorae]
MGPGHLEQLLQPKMAEIRRYLIRLGAGAADAEDIVQDTVYKALLYLEAIDERKFSAWLYKAAINRYYDLCRRQKRLQYDEEPGDYAVSESELPEETLLRREQKDLIERVLGKLNPVHRQLILMKYEMELSYREIASLLDISEGKVKASLYRARQQFQHYYGGEA